MSLVELRCVCVSHGFTPRGTSKSEVLEEIENELHLPEDKRSKLLLEDGSASASASASSSSSSSSSGRGKSAATAMVIDESDGDSEYDPDE